ncbi:and nb-arc protein [Fusarium langsethiae]|uniref:And nb-arc protein n=1 Tax=Fusarium langsethiae TaxID=179993 RepID=A0A0N0DIG5_FUSLA|nr:and nb-arc protein [Fusarium langsethiae]GKT97908.1 unnamed protein product [Fusarium langsethiae]GKU13438.1 unnamed protein product [Fusarium langsethiae]
MGTENREISRYETTAVYSHPEAKVDIVLVHGLNGEPDRTWTAKGGTFWPLDLLPVALKGAHASILVYGYNADVYSKGYDRTTSNHFINQHAEDLVTNLMLHRRSQGTSKNPIIWVCHSLGGILVKRALLYSHDVRETHLEDLGSIYVSTFGLIFLATPHVGSDAATWGVIIQAMANALIPKRFFDSEPVLLKTLRKDNETLANINSHFLDIYQRFEVHMVRENQKTDVKGKRHVILTSLAVSISIHDRLTVQLKPTTLKCQWVEKAPCLIQGRWFVAEDESRNRTLSRVNEIMSPLTSYYQMDTSHIAVMMPHPSGSSTPLPAYSEDADKYLSYWAPDLTINTNSASYLWPPRSEMSIPYTSAFPWSSHAPYFTAIGPSPWYDVTPVNNVPLGYQAWQPRQPVPWNFYDASREGLTYSPRQGMSSESTEVMRSSSEESQFNGNLIEFWQPEPRSPRTEHLSETELLPPENQGTRQETSLPPDYGHSWVPE